MTVVSCSIDERYVNPLFEVFDGGDFILTSYRDVEETSATMQIFVPDPVDAPRAAEALVAAVTVDGPDFDVAALEAAAAANLARFKQPKAIHILPELPRNAMGKVVKTELRKRYAESFSGQ